MRPQTMVVLAVPTAALVYGLYVRPWQLTWGATPAEVSRSLPSDGLVKRPTFHATRAITIPAAPTAVWPWLVQMGATRAGWCSYDLLDNLRHRSARRIIPELQRLAEGDIIPMSPDGKQGMRVLSLEAPHSMVWGEPGGTTWAWQLDETADGGTRLITRVRSQYKWLSPSIAFSVLVEFGDVWMGGVRANEVAGCGPEEDRRLGPRLRGLTPLDSARPRKAGGVTRPFASTRR